MDRTPVANACGVAVFPSVSFVQGGLVAAAWSYASMLGGALLLAFFGGGPFSIDTWQRKHTPSIH